MGTDTKTCIMNAYIALLEQKRYHKITVREIAEKAYIQRSTFYQYFDNIHDLLNTIELELLEGMNFYKKPDPFDPKNIEPLPSIEAWFDYCIRHRTYLNALMGENGDVYFEKEFKKKICQDIHRMMDEEQMPKDALRPYCVELTYSIHFSLMKFAIGVKDIRSIYNANTLTCLANHWRSSAILAEAGGGIFPKNVDL